VADVVSEPAPLARPRPEPQVGRHRFGIAYLVLAAIVGTAVGLTVVFATRGGDHEQPVVRWSSWQPTTTGTLGVREIARHVGPRYVRANGQQLVSVVAGPMAFPSPQGPIPVTAILVSPGNAGVTSDAIDVVQPGAGAFYHLCGTGDANCVIPGTSTPNRGRLVIREAVELALYTFHYLPEATDVVVFLPPPRGVTQQDPKFQRAVYLPRSVLNAALAKPLSSTLSSETSTVSPDTLPADELNAIVGLTSNRVFHYDFQQAAGNAAYLLLAPLEP
jgi:hypothetical protein